MKINDLLKEFVESNEDEYLLNEQKFFLQAMGDNDNLCNAFTIRQTMRTKGMIKSGVVLEILLDKLSTKVEPGVLVREEVEEYLNLFTDEDSSEYRWCKDAEILAHVTSYDLPESYAGYISDEVMRLFELHFPITPEDISSPIDEIICTISSIFDIGDEFKETALSVKTSLLKPLMDYVYSQGDLTLMTQAKKVYGILTEWR